MVAAAGPLNRFGGGRHLWLATVPVAESPLNGGLSVANEAQPIFFCRRGCGYRGGVGVGGRMGRKGVTAIAVINTDDDGDGLAR